MDFHSGANLLLEALAYLGRRAGGFSTEWMLERLHSRGVTELGQLQDRLLPITRLAKILDRAVKVDAERLQYLFGNLPGFPYSTIGSYSRGFLLLYPMAAAYAGGIQAAWQALKDRPRARIAGDLSMLLDLGEEPELSAEVFSARVLGLQVPAESKVAVLELYHQGDALREEAQAIVRRVVNRLEKEQALLEECCAPFNRELEELGPAAMLAQLSSLNASPGHAELVRPFLFGMDTVLAVTPEAPAPVQVFCGVLRRELQAALASARGPEVEVCEAIRLLADQTRFDILCYLRDHDAYGQELAARFSLSRNTIHHHMTKLLSAHLVKCTVDGNRVYYRVDEASVSRLLDRQRELLLPKK